MIKTMLIIFSLLSSGAIYSSYTGAGLQEVTSKYKKTKHKRVSKDPNIMDLEKELSEKIGLKTELLVLKN